MREGTFRPIQPTEEDRVHLPQVCSSHRSKEDWIGLKAHFVDHELEAPPADGDAVELFLLPFGYCGVQPVISEGERRWNACCMVRASAATRLSQVLAAHPALAARSRQWEQPTETVSTAPLIFGAAAPLDESGALAVGDAAAFIDPFVGDGIAIALRSGAMAGALAAEQCTRGMSNTESSKRYCDWYGKTIAPALRNAARLRRVMELPRALQASLIRTANIFGVGEWLVRATRSRRAQSQEK